MRCETATFDLRDGPRRFNVKFNLVTRFAYVVKSQPTEVVSECVPFESATQMEAERLVSEAFPRI